MSHYRFDNMILTQGGEVAAGVDWELCALGDPLADVGLLMVYRPEAGDELVALGQPATLAPGFPTGSSCVPATPSAWWRQPTRPSDAGERPGQAP